MYKRIFGLAIALGALVLWLAVPVAYGQTPAGPTTVFKTTFAVDNPPSEFDVIQDVVDFQPGAWTTPHVHGGVAYVTVAQGQVTYRGTGKEVDYKVGETFMENPGNPMQAGNRTSAPARDLATFLLPQGAQLTSAADLAGGELRPVLQPKKSENKFSVVNAPKQFDLIETEMDFAPGAVTPVHTHGGPAFISVISGELTLRENGTEKTYKAGEAWTENPGQFMQVANKGTAPASTFATFLLPQGAQLTTNQQQEAPLSAAASTPIWLLATVSIVALLIIGAGALIVRRRFTNR